MILVDTNVLVYASNQDAPEHVEARQVVEAAVRGTFSALLLPQVLVECFSVITNPRRVKKPLSAAQGRELVGYLRGAMEVRHVPVASLEELDDLLSVNPRTGAEVFDLFLVAQMRCHGCQDICTYNVSDFQVSGITAVTPIQLLASLDDVS